jgi:hypothetical protein
MADVTKSRDTRQPSAPADQKKTTLTEAAIRERAYQRYVERGGGPGRQEEDWREAERELREKTRR